jgi:phosphatidylglycerol:prolipoprotein diacylglycerol transferase
MKKFRADIGIILVVAIIALIAFLWVVFSGRVVLSPEFHLGFVRIRFYGITMALAVGAGWWLATKRAGDYGIEPSKVDSFLLWLAIGGFIGARLYHVASSWQYYAEYPSDIIKIWNGGLSIYGALIGGLIVLCLLAFRGFPSAAEGNPLKGRVLRCLDWLAPSVVVGMIIGRFGNFFNYEAFGYPTSLPWKMFVPTAFRPESLAGSSFFHPLFLYEAIGNALILWLLLYLSRPINRHATKMRIPGTLFFVYLILYNALRFGLEHLRVDSTFLWGNIRLNALVSGLLFIVGVVLLLTRLPRRKASSQ